MGAKRCCKMEKELTLVYFSVAGQAGVALPSARLCNLATSALGTTRLKLSVTADQLSSSSTALAEPV